MSTRPSPAFARRAKPDYIPRVMPRALRPDGLLRYTPNYPDPSDTKTKYFVHAVTTTRETVLAPSLGKRLRVVHLRAIHEPINAGAIRIELYFGTSATIADSGSTPIDTFSVNGIVEQTRAWPRGQGPRGAKDEVLSIRESSTVAGGSVYLVIDYTEER